VLILLSALVFADVVVVVVAVVEVVGKQDAKKVQCGCSTTFR
jgi:hypothetical protein